MNRASSAAWFPAPWGAALKTITAVSLVVLVGVAFILLTTVPATALRSISIAIMFILIAVTALYAVRGYTIENGALIIHRTGWQTRIPLDRLQSAVPDPTALRNSLRLFGNGGLFAFTGVFWSRKLGRFRVYVTDLSKSVVLRFADRVIVVSPGSPGRFIEALPK